MILAYEDNFDGFLTAVFEAFSRKSQNISLANIKNPLPGLLETEHITANLTKAGRVISGMDRLNPNLKEITYKAWLSCEEDIDDAIVNTLKLGFSNHSNPMSCVYETCVKRILFASKKVGWEVQRAYQFVRFINTGNGIYASDYEPLYDILHLIGRHFHARFSDRPFIIRDASRKIAIISTPENWTISHLSQEQSTLPFLEQDQYTDMWKSYFEILSNPQRKNLKLQQKFIPLRYRKHLTEFN